MAMAVIFHPKVWTVGEEESYRESYPSIASALTLHME